MNFFLGDVKGWKVAHEKVDMFFWMKDLKRILSEVPYDSIIQLGGRQIHFNDLNNFLDCHDILENYLNVFLILPNEEIKKAESILAERIKIRENNSEKELPDLLTFNKDLINSRTM